MVAWTDAAFVRPSSAAIVALAAVIVGAPLLPLAHLVFLGVGAPLVAAMAPLLLPIAAAIWPLAKISVDRRGAVAAMLLLAVVAGDIALRIDAAPLAPTVPAYALDK